MARQRPKKIWRLSFWKKDAGTSIALLGSPGEIRLNASPRTFMSISDDGISLSPGLGNQLNLQAMSSNFKYGGMVSDLPFPMSMIPSTMATPFPKQIFVPPLMDILPVIRDLTAMSSAFVGL